MKFDKLKMNDVLFTVAVTGIFGLGLVSVLPLGASANRAGLVQDAVLSDGRKLADDDYCSLNQPPTGACEFSSFLLAASASLTTSTIAMIGVDLYYSLLKNTPRKKRGDPRRTARKSNGGYDSNYKIKRTRTTSTCI